MKLLRTYPSLNKAKSKFNLLLFLCFLAQVFCYSIGSIKIPLPTRFLEVFLNSIFPDGAMIEIERPYIIGLSKLESKSLRFIFDNQELIQLSNPSISFAPSMQFAHFSILPSQVKFVEAKILSNIEDNTQFQFDEFSLQKIAQDDSFRLKSKLAIGEIQANIQIELRNFIATLQSSKSKPLQPELNLNNLLSTAQKLKKDIMQADLKSVPININLWGEITPQDGKLYLSQINEGEEFEIKSLLTFLKWSTVTQDEKSAVLEFHTSADQFPLNPIHSSPIFIMPYLRGEIEYDLSQRKITDVKSYFQYDQLLLDGKISGSLPRLGLYFNREKNKFRTHIFSETNQTDIGLIVDSRDANLSIDGKIRIVPKNTDLSVQLPQGNLKLIDGDQFSLSFRENLTAVCSQSPVQFWLSAYNFSALETPPGDFEFTGEISPDYFIFVNNAYGKLGQSEVTGTYYQKWMPAEYRFLINGTCYPPDIDNWLGLWWSPLWKDFSFDKEIPAGNFSISGIWGGKPGNSVTIGQVETKEFIFRRFPINFSKIDVKVDKNSTRISGKKVSHSTGEIQGKLIFPRAFENNDSLLHFSFKGDFPVNDAKHVLGEHVENTLRDFNASSVYLESTGELFREDSIYVTNRVNSWYELYVSTDSPFSYFGMNFDYAHGKISSKEGLIRGNFEEFGLAGGRGLFNFNQLSVHSDRISVKVDLKNAQRSELVDQLSYWQDSDHSFLDTQPNQNPSENNLEGKIDFSLQAEGHYSNTKHFEGSGNLHLYDVDVGSIHFLGGIRSKLGAFNVPLPSDALNFNQLHAPFILDHERLLFDQASLSGPLSLILANGNVNWATKDVDLLAEFKLAGNLQIPVLKQIVNLADPLSRLSKLKIYGKWENPEWSVHLGTSTISP